MSEAEIRANPAPKRPRPIVPRERDSAPIPAGERAFFVEEFRGVTIVVVAADRSPTRASRPSPRTIAGFAPGDTRFVLVVELRRGRRPAGAPRRRCRTVA